MNGDSLQNVLAAMKKQPPARRSKADFELKWVFAGLAGLLFLAAYLPKHPIKESTEMLKQFVARKTRKAAKSVA